MRPSTPTDDDLLLAVRYLLNECDAGEVATFENRLAEDALAQDALVEATQIVTLLQSTPVCPEFVTPVPRIEKVRSWGIGALWLTMCLLVAVAVAWRFIPSEPSMIATVTDSLVLAQSWSTLALSEITEEADSEVADPSEADSVEEAISSSEEIPDWLITAVLVAEGETDSESPEMDQNTETQL